MKLKPLAKDDVVSVQKRGYFDEHLASLYSTAYGKPYLFQNNYLVYHDSLSKTTWLTLFGLDGKENTRQDLTEYFENVADFFKPAEVVTTSPTPLPSDLNDFHSEAVYEDRDYQINLSLFDENLGGGEYKQLRYRVKNGEKRGYTFAVGNDFTLAHSRIVALHMTKTSYAAWDYQLYLRLGEYFREFSSPKLFSVFLDDALVAFDVADLMSRTMAIPLGFYLDYPSLADFLLHREILQGKAKGFEWLDIGWACNNAGLEAFKRKWHAVPRFNVFMQDFKKK